MNEDTELRIEITMSTKMSAWHRNKCLLDPVQIEPFPEPIFVNISAKRFRERLKEILTLELISGIYATLIDHRNEIGSTEKEDSDLRDNIDQLINLMNQGENENE